MKERNSNIELLRIVALWMIVAYHTFVCITQNHADAESIYKAIWLPLHVGVVVFVLISGYFRIRPSVKGMVRLLSYMFVYTVPVGLWYITVNGWGGVKSLETFLFVSHSPFWFMRTYVMLYIAAPIINYLIEKFDSKQIIKLILILSVIAVYMGMAHSDYSVINGKNVVNFCLIYVIGACISKYRLWLRWNKWTYLLIYLFLNAIEMVLYMLFSGGMLGEVLFYVNFQYCSPILIFNAIMLFCFALNVEFKSRVINWFAKSSIAIYFIHTIILNGTISPIASSIYEKYSTPLLVIPAIFLLSAIVSLCCMLADKILSPVWKLTELLVKPIERGVSYIKKIMG